MLPWLSGAGVSSTSVGLWGTSAIVAGRPLQPAIAKSTAAAKIAVKIFFIRSSSDPEIAVAQTLRGAAPPRRAYTAFTLLLFYHIRKILPL